MDLNSRRKDIDRSEGLSAVASWVSQDVDHETLIVRRFDWLSAHNILYMQIELIELEAQLKLLYKAARIDMDLAQSCRRYSPRESEPRSEKEVQRLQLIRTIEDKIRTYHKALLRQSRIAALGRPRSIVLDLFRTWLNGEGTTMHSFPIPGRPLGGKPDPVLEGGAQFMLDEEQDLASLHSPPEHDILTRFLTNNWLGGQRHQRGATKAFE